MLRVGLTGGLATGKSFVGQALVDLGCQLLKADELGHAALLPDGGAYAAVVEAFGTEILDENGHVARRKLGTAVFGNPDRLQKLNEIIHPIVIREEEAWIERLRRQNGDVIAVVEAAILIETGSHKRFDKLVLTVCGAEQQIERAMKRDGLSREEVATRLRRQMPLDEKRKFADFIIDTSGAKPQTLVQVHELYDRLRSLMP